MAETDIGSADYSDLRTVQDDYSVDSQSLDSGGDQKEFEWQMTDWPQWLGYYKEIPELQTAIDAKAIWTMGAGFTAEPATELLLMSIRGNGKDSFNGILSNMVRGYTIGGDSFAEIITNKDGELINLKPLDPSTIVIVYNDKGMIKRYEQVSKIRSHMSKVKRKRFSPNKIFHLSRKRLADEVHGISVIPSVEWIILARNEAMSDWKRVMHRNISPLIIWHLDTDDETEIAAQKTKTDKATSLGENMYIPKGTVVPEVVSTAQNATLNPLPWIDKLGDYFFQAVNVPQIIVGNAKEFTDASSKIVYLSYEQSVKAEQLYVEEQVLGQLNLEIQLTFPASLQQEMITDQPNPNELVVEEEPVQSAVEPNDQQVEVEGRK